jgi:RNA recognition motif-containing protein
VGNLDYSTKIGDVRELFCGFGEIKDIYLPRTETRDQCKGFAFVEFGEPEYARNAVTNCQDLKSKGGRRLIVKKAETRKAIA